MHVVHGKPRSWCGSFALLLLQALQQDQDWSELPLTELDAGEDWELGEGEQDEEPAPRQP